MSVNIRYPNITALKEKEQIVQIKSYLHQLVEQLNYELTTLGSLSGSASTTEVQGEEISYYELKSLIVQELQKVDDLFGELSEKMQDEYLREEDIDSIANQAAQIAIPQAATQVAEKITFTMDEEGNLYYEVEETNYG